MKAVGLGGLGAQTALAVGLVGLEVALKPVPAAGVLVVALPGQDVGGNAVQEPAVVGDDHGAAGEVLQGLLQGLQGLHVQVIGGLVEQQQVSALLEREGQVQAVALAAGEHAGRLYDANVSKKDTTRLLTAFCDTVTADGYTAGVYANSHFYISKFDAASLPKGTLRWVADYNSAVTYTGDFDIWQYSKIGKIKGNGSKYIDLNRWYLGGS